MPKSRAEIPEEFKSIEEIQNFWDQFSTAEYWDEMEDVDLQLSLALKSKLESKKIVSFTPKTTTTVFFGY